MDELIFRLESATIESTTTESSRAETSSTMNPDAMPIDDPLVGLAPSMGDSTRAVPVQPTTPIGLTPSTNYVPLISSAQAPLKLREPPTYDGKRARDAAYTWTE